MDNSLYNIYQTFPSIFGNSGYINPTQTNQRTYADVFLSSSQPTNYPIPQNRNYIDFNQIDPIQESKGLIGTDSIQGKIPKFSELGELDLNKSQIVYNYSVGVLGTYVLYINDIYLLHF